MTNSSLRMVAPLRAGWNPGFTRLCKFLSEQIGRQIGLSMVRDFDEVRDLVSGSDADLGVLTSTGYVQARRLDPRVQYLATAAASEGNGPPQASYGGSIITRKDSGVSTLSELEGKPFAFVSMASSSGFKYPVVSLKRAGVDYKTYFGNLMFMGDHPFVTDVVAAGIAAGGATWEGNLAKAMQTHGDVFLELQTFGPIVNHAVVAARTMPAEVAAAITAALLVVPASVIGTDGFPYAGFEKLGDDAYDEAREVSRLERQLSGPTSVRRPLPANEFRAQSLTGVLDLLREVRVALDHKQGGGRFVKREPTPLLSDRSVRELAAAVSVQTAELAKAFPTEAGSLPATIGPWVLAVADERISPSDAVGNTRQVLQTLAALLIAVADPKSTELLVSADGQDVIVEASTESLDERPDLVRALRNDTDDQRAIGAVSALLERRRQENSDLPTGSRRSQPLEERLALLVVYGLLSRGAVVRGPYQSLGISGFREIHTYLFNTDPGEGHLTVTCSDIALMRGTAVHVEHIDRDKEFNKDKIEAYRLPAAVNAAKVRLHVGACAPTTAFIGRPVFESGTFRLDLLKSVHMTASACTAMFMNGIADCKIAIERMTTTEAVEFMKAVVGNVIRDKTKQYLRLHSTSIQHLSMIVRNL
jgi:ABC-type phosphate/phosphonate transport system substrate-binding protein